MELASPQKFDAATSLLVSQFIMEQDLKLEFFKDIADRLKTKGIMISSDLSANLNSVHDQSLLETWLAVMAGGGVPPEGITNTKNAYGKSVAVIPENEITALIKSAGFEKPNHFYQVGMIHAWYCAKAE